METIKLATTIIASITAFEMVFSILIVPVEENADTGVLKKWEQKILAVLRPLQVYLKYTHPFTFGMAILIGLRLLGIKIPLSLVWGSICLGFFALFAALTLADHKA